MQGSVADLPARLIRIFEFPFVKPTNFPTKNSENLLTYKNAISFDMLAVSIQLSTLNWFWHLAPQVVGRSRNEIVGFVRSSVTFLIVCCFFTLRRNIVKCILKDRVLQNKSKNISKHFHWPAKWAVARYYVQINYVINRSTLNYFDANSEEFLKI